MAVSMYLALLVLGQEQKHFQQLNLNTRTGYSNGEQQQLQWPDKLEFFEEPSRSG